MTWTVTYRDKAGKQDYITVEAESRTELFAVLNERKITPIRVAQGELKNPRKNNHKGNVFRKISLGAVAVVCIGIIAWVVIDSLPRPDNDGTKAPIKKRQLKPIVKQAIPRNPQTNSVGQATNCVVKKIDDDKYRDERGILRYKKTGTRAFDPDRPRRKINLNVGPDGKPLYKLSPFKTRPENEIYRLIKIAPGDTLFGTRVYDERFEAEYLKSLEAPILISDEDDEDTVAAKKAMIEVKAEINDRMRNGEKLADILNETKSELKRLADIKRMIRTEVISTVKEGAMSEAEVNDYIQAANTLLSEKGIAPIKGNMILRMNLIMKNKQGTEK